MRNAFAALKDKVFYKLLFLLEGWRSRKKLRLIQRDTSLRLRDKEVSRSTLVIGNAIPKSGTYLLNAIIRELGCWHIPGLHLMSHVLVAMEEDGRSSRVYPSLVSDVINSLPRGIAVAAHLKHDSRLADLLASSPEVKHVFLYRDFRDIFCSFNNWMTKFDEAGHAEPVARKQRFYRDFFECEDDSLAYTSCSMMEGEGFEGYTPWLKDPSTLCLRFEDVYNDLLACSNGGFGQHLLSLFDFLAIDSYPLDPAGFAQRVLGKGWTSSGRRDKIGQFRRKFKPHHYQLIDNIRFRSLMQSYGMSID